MQDAFYTLVDSQLRMVRSGKEAQHCCEEPSPAELGYMDDSGSREGEAGTWILLKVACCGVPLLAIALASGALAFGAVLGGAAGLALVAVAFLLLRPLVRGSAAGRPRAPAEQAEHSVPLRPTPPAPIVVETRRDDRGRAETPEREVPAGAR